MNSTTETPYLHPLSRVLPKRPEGPMRAPARVLGWFSIGLGVVELLLPRQVARAAGAIDVPALTRAHGVREIGVGVALLTAKDPQPWLWARVAGDALDVATVGAGLPGTARPARTLVSLALLAGVGWLDVMAARGAAPKRVTRPVRDYSTRSGFPRPAAEMRGAAQRPLAARTASAP